MTIDYSKLNDRIVKQAYNVLTEAQVKQLVQDKVDRAKALADSREYLDRGSKYSTSR